MDDALKKKISPALWLSLLNRYWHDKRHERRYQRFKNLRPEDYPDAIKKWYKKRTGENLNLEHPVTFNEKIQWLRLYDATPQKLRLADKYLIRDWIAEKIGAEYLIPLLGVYDNFDDINFDVLPEKFVIKANYDTGANLIVTDKSKFDVAEGKEFFDREMRIDYELSREMEVNYRDIVQKIMIEEYLENSADGMYDFKFWCFGGRAHFVSFQTSRQGERRRVTIFDREWKKMPFKYGNNPEHEGTIEKPENLDRMLNLAETLAAGFAHVRVDFFTLGDGTIKFGEMTFAPGSGRYRWIPAEYNKIVGDLIKLPTKNLSAPPSAQEKFA